MSILDFLVQVLAYSLFVGPIVVLIIGAILYHYKPKHRFSLGIILTSLGSLGVLIYSATFYISIRMNEAFGPFVWLVIVEVSTVIVGIISFVNRNRVHAQ